VYVPTFAGQQRNVSLYITHLLLDTAALIYVWQAMIEIWLGLSETTGVTSTGSRGFNYIVACYALELTWRRSVDTMLAVHHVGTIVIILLYAGEFLVSTAAAAAAAAAAVAGMMLESVRVVLNVVQSAALSCNACVSVCVCVQPVIALVDNHVCCLLVGNDSLVIAHKRHLCHCC
jgi:Ethanolamine utilization protein EutJ (predicted chaperonin)